MCEYYANAPVWRKTAMQRGIEAEMIGDAPCYGAHGRQYALLRCASTAKTAVAAQVRERTTATLPPALELQRLVIQALLKRCRGEGEIHG